MTHAEERRTLELCFRTPQKIKLKKNPKSSSPSRGVCTNIFLPNYFFACERKILRIQWNSRFLKQILNTEYPHNVNFEVSTNSDELLWKSFFDVCQGSNKEIGVYVTPIQIRNLSPTHKIFFYLHLPIQKEVQLDPI